MKRLCLGVACVAAMLAAGPAFAQQGVGAPVGVVSNVKVISDKVEDVTTLEDWKATYIKPGMSDQDKALAIWRTVVKYRHQASPPNDGISAAEGEVHDPMKTIHVYGYGQCCCASSNVEGLARYIGLPAQGRVIRLHSVPELFYGKAWHLIDGSMMNYFTKEDGTLASVDEIRHAVMGWFAAHPEYKNLRGNGGALHEFAANNGWKRGPELLNSSKAYDADGANAAGQHGWYSTMQEYDYGDDKAGIFDYGPSMGYQVNVQLRVGEKLTRCWSNKGMTVNGDMPVNGRQGLNLQRKLGDVAPGRIGNGVLEYDVPLANGEFRRGALTAENLTSQGELNITIPPILRALDPAKPGVLVVRMPSSYVFLKGRAELKAVVGEGGSIVVSVSDNNGLNWKEAQKIAQTGDVTVDLTKLVFRRYDYRLKVELNGNGTGLNALKITNDIQHSQAPLPAILPGANKITFSAGPQEGTITLEGCMNPDQSAGKQVAYTDFHPEVTGLAKSMLTVGDTGTGTATFSVPTPGDITRVRMNAHYRARDARDGFDAEVSFDEGKTFAALGKFEGPFKASSKYLIFDKVPAGARLALVRLVGHQRNTALIFDLRIDVDYKEPMGGFRPVQITYVWTEDGQDKTDVHVARQPKDAWTITCAQGAVPKSYTVELAK